MATEMFLKAYLGIFGSITEEDARKRFSHDLDKLLRECARVRSSSDLDNLSELTRVFPPIGDRYRALEYDGQQLWSGYDAALRLA